MSVTYVNRVRQVVAAEDDDFFGNDTLLYYLNRSLKKVVGFLIQQELRPTITTQEGVIRGNDRSLRALDNLRLQTSSGVSGVSSVNDYFVGTVDYPSDLIQTLYLRYGTKTPLRELLSQKLYHLEWGNIKPSLEESYYYATNISGKKFQVFLPEDPDATQVTINYIKEPTALTLASETLTDLPNQLENAIIYGAALMVLGQESVKDSEGNPSVIAQIYQEELQNNTY